MTQSAVDALRERSKELAYEMSQQDVAAALSWLRRQAAQYARETAREFEAAVGSLAARAALAEEPREQGAESRALVNDSWAGDWLTNGAELHPLTINLVVRFARALAAKLAEAEKKYGYTDGWRREDWLDECRAHLREHVAKGDPRDVAAYCAFLWHHGASTAEQGAETLPPLTDEQIDKLVIQSSLPFVSYGAGYWDVDGLISKTDMRAFARAAIAASGSAPVAESPEPSDEGHTAIVPPTCRERRAHTMCPTAMHVSNAIHPQGKT